MPKLETSICINPATLSSSAGSYPYSKKMGVPARWAWAIPAFSDESETA